MVFYKTIPTPAEIAKGIPGGHENIYRACAALLSDNEDLLDSEKFPRAKVEECLARVMNR